MSEVKRPISFVADDLTVGRQVFSRSEAKPYMDHLEAELAKLRTERDRLRREMGLTAAQRTSYEVIEEEGSDEHADYRGAYDLIIEQTRAALQTTQQEDSDETLRTH